MATLMALNIQFTNMDEGSTISLSYLRNLAFAQGGENDGGDDEEGSGWLWQKKGTDTQCTNNEAGTFALLDVKDR